MKTEYKIGDTLCINETNYKLIDAELLGLGNYGKMTLMDENNQLFIWSPGNGASGFPYVLNKPYRHGGFLDIYYKDGVIYQDKNFTDDYPVSYESFISEQLGNNRLSFNVDDSLDFSLKFSQTQIEELNNDSPVDKEEVEEVETLVITSPVGSTTTDAKPHSLSTCTFAADSYDLMNISTSLENYADSVRNLVTDIYSIIDVDLADAWQGDTYLMFSDMCHEQQNTLNDLNTLLYAFSSMYKSVADETDILQDIFKQNIDYRFGGDVDGN